MEQTFLSILNADKVRHAQSLNYIREDQLILTRFLRFFLQCVKWLLSAVFQLVQKAFFSVFRHDHR